MTIDQVNNLSRADFVERFGTVFQDGRWIAERASEKRPFGNVYDLRRAFQDAVFDAPPEQQLELIRAYPDLGRLVERDQAESEFGISSEEYDMLREASVGRLMGAQSLRDQSSAGLDRLSPQEYEDFQRLNDEYRKKFGFPLVIAVREHTKETILRNGRARMENPPAQERATALVEIAKIANLRLQDLVEEPVEELVPAERA